MTARAATGRLLRVGATWTVGGFVLALLLATALPLVVGDRSYVVRSGSMAPAIDTGDVVVVEPIAPAHAHVGDIVTFKLDGKLTTHRARAVERRGSTIHFVTQGDANTGRERWKAPQDGQIGRVTYRVPKLGHAVVKIQSLPGRIVLVVLPAVLLTMSLLRRIWRDEPRGERADGLAG